MMSNFFLFPISSQSRVGISHIHGHRGFHGGPKTTRDTPRVATFCFVCLLMLVCSPAVKISLYKAVITSFLPYLSLDCPQCTSTALVAPIGPKTTGDTPKVAAFCGLLL